MQHRNNIKFTFAHFLVNYIMAKESKPKPKKERADKYEEKVAFDGTFEQMIGISVKQAAKKVAKPKEKK